MIYVSRSSNWSMEMHLMLGCLLFSSKAYKQMIGHMHGSQNYWKPLGFHGNRRNRSSLVSSDNWLLVKKNEFVYCRKTVFCSVLVLFKTVNHQFYEPWSHVAMGLIMLNDVQNLLVASAQRRAEHVSLFLRGKNMTLPPTHMTISLV